MKKRKKTRSGGFGSGPGKGPAQGEYRREGNVYTLYINGKERNMHIYRLNPGQPPPSEAAAPLPGMWIADGGGVDSNHLLTYPSEEDAFYGELQRIKRIYHTDAVLWPGTLAPPFTEPDTALRTPTGDPVWRLYQVERYLDPTLGEICETLTGHCEKGPRIYLDGGPLPSWFRVCGSTRKDPEGIAVEGGMGPSRFKFYTSPGGFFFAVDRLENPKHTFFVFMSLINRCRISRGLEGLSVAYLYRIDAADSPRALNYTVYTGGALKALQDCLEGTCRHVSHQGLFSRFGIIIYSENSTKGTISPESARACQELLAAFKQFYCFDEARLFCVRDGPDQHLYFSVHGVGLFYNSEDSSLPFLERQGRYLTGAISAYSKVFNKVTGKESK
jgi:hypothetical protein